MHAIPEVAAVEGSLQGCTKMQNAAAHCFPSLLFPDMFVYTRVRVCACLYRFVFLVFLSITALVAKTM